MYTNTPSKLKLIIFKPEVYPVQIKVIRVVVNLFTARSAPMYYIFLIHCIHWQKSNDMRLIFIVQLHLLKLQAETRINVQLNVSFTAVLLFFFSYIALRTYPRSPYLPALT